MTQYWLTVHEPHPDPDTLPWHIYLQDKHKDACNGICLGDVVFFYETKGTKAIDLGKTQTGNMGIVRMGTVVGEIYHRELSEAIHNYSDGVQKNWAWCIPVETTGKSGFISRNDLNTYLGYKSNYYYRGFNHGRGVKLLKESLGIKLLQLLDCNQ